MTGSLEIRCHRGGTGCKETASLPTWPLGRSATERGESPFLLVILQHPEPPGPGERIQGDVLASHPFSLAGILIFTAWVGVAT